MRIAITVDPYIPVPPERYGGIERIVAMLAEGLVARGHHVTLFAHPESQCGNKLVPYGVAPHRGLRPRLAELSQVACGLWRQRREFDIVHSFGRLAALLPILPLRNLPKIQTYHRPRVPWSGVKKATRLAGNSIHFTSCSDSVYRERPRHGVFGGDWTTVYNSIPISHYQFVESVVQDARLVYLGKLEPLKGVHLAIEVARRAGRRLIIAGNRVSEGADRHYFSEHILPHIDNDHVLYVGEVNDRQKSELLGQAAGLLFLTQHQEAFGLVSIEAMACGTPVIGSANGGVPEVIRQGVNGFICSSVETAVEAVSELSAIDRNAVRRDCEARFSVNAMVDSYEKLYQRMIHLSAGIDTSANPLTSAA